MTFQRPILWIHEEALGANNPALQAWPEAPAVFVFDTRWIQEARISRKRLGFLYENALDLPLTLRKGDVADEVLAFARRHQADGVVSSSAVDPRLERIREAIDAELPLERWIQNHSWNCRGHPGWDGSAAVSYTHLRAH